MGRCRRTVQRHPRVACCISHVAPAHRPRPSLRSPIASSGVESDADVAGRWCPHADHASNTAPITSTRRHTDDSSPVALGAGVMTFCPHTGTAMHCSGTVRTSSPVDPHTHTRRWSVKTSAWSTACEPGSSAWIPSPWLQGRQDLEQARPAVHRAAAAAMGEWPLPPCETEGNNACRDEVSRDGSGVCPIKPMPSGAPGSSSDRQ